MATDLKDIHMPLTIVAQEDANFIAPTGVHLPPMLNLCKSQIPRA